MHRALTHAAVASLLALRSLSAQTTDNAKTKTFFMRDDGIVAAGFLGGAAVVSVFDVRLERFFRDTVHLHVREGQHFDSLFTHINETTLTVGGLAVYGVARLLRAETVADIAFHTAESVAAASLSSQVIRGPLGRTRPRDSDPPYDDQYEFHVFRGFTNFKYRAFPSIHSSSGFAAASAITAEVRLRDPRATWFVGVPAYLLALTPGLSRLYLGQHWMSDVVAGAFLGTFYGWRTVDYSHDHHTTPVDRIFLGTARRAQGAHVSVAPGGIALSYSTRF